MSPCTMQSLLGLAAFAALTFSDVTSTAAVAQPRVFGLDFTKQAVRNTPETNRLRRRQKSLSVDIDNAEIAYLINMTIGTPPQMFQVQLDTGSSDIWVPSVLSDVCSQGEGACPGGAFDESQSSTFTDVARDAFSISYQDNSAVTGDYITDVVQVGKTTLKNVTMGLATQASRALGIMGIGYVADESIVSSDPTSTYPNIVSQLKDQKVINTLAYSLWLNDLNSLTGSILFGGIDTAKFKQPLIVLPVQKGPNGTYTDFTVTLSSFGFSDPSGKSQYSQNNLALPVILDSGTTATYLPDNIAQDVLNGVGAINNEDYGYIVPCSLANSPDIFTFGFGGNGGPSISVSFGEFVTPIFNEDGSQPTFSDGSGTVCTWGLLSSGDPTQPILLGDTFLRSAYVVYDVTNNQIGMAQTDFNATNTNVVEISGSAIPSATATATLAAQPQVYTGHPLEQGHTKTGAAGAGATGPVKSATFNLGVAGASGTNSPGKKSAGAALSPPRMDVAFIATGFVIMISMVFGGSLIVMM